VSLGFQYALIFAVLLAAELLYFKIADRYNIIDKPNNRSSHTGLIIRGGGVIFILAVWCWFVTSDFTWPWFTLGATLLAIISFLDDVKPQRQLVRFSIHLTVVLLLFYDAQLLSWPVWLIVLAVLVCIGTINAFNFMDGINGITGIHAVVSLVTFLYIQEFIYPFSRVSLMIISLLSVIIFLFFNFRKHARCFAGDVGSTTLAFIQVFLLLQLIVYTDNFFWVIMFLVFGIDSVVTIVYRLLKKENIFRAHRTHVYQYLSNEIGLPHTTVAGVYGIIQFVLNVSLVVYLPESGYQVPLLFSAGFILLYMIVRSKISGMIATQNKIDK
jgi:UDP-N-acetylmuramyl pentapeptide phosphotransferase/UDP-N-acetylglucosamine-1-phosphate transferase